MSHDGSDDESLPAFIERLGRELTQGNRTSIDLDEVASALGDQASNTVAISALLEFLESRGILVESGLSPELAPLLRDVLAVARTERSRGAQIRIAAIAERLQVEPRLVRVALLYAEVLMRG